jgi:hypothetical protein
VTHWSKNHSRSKKKKRKKKKKKEKKKEKKDRMTRFLPPHLMRLFAPPPPFSTLSPPTQREDGLVRDMPRISPMAPNVALFETGPPPADWTVPVQIPEARERRRTARTAREARRIDEEMVRWNPKGEAPKGCVACDPCPLLRPFFFVLFCFVLHSCEA